MNLRLYRDRFLFSIEYLLLLMRRVDVTLWLLILAIKKIQIKYLTPYSLRLNIEFHSGQESRIQSRIRFLNSRV